MDELNPTIKERQIYHEMKLTPAMVKSIRTLCGVCLRHYVETKAFKIAIVPNGQSCQTARMEEIRFSHLYGLQRQVPQGCPADEILINQRKGHYDDRQVFSGRREPSCG